MKYSNVRPLKKSNEDWVESIPMDWTEKKVSLIFETIGSGTTPSTLEDDNYGAGVPWVTTGELRESRITRTQKEVPNEVFDRTSALKKFPVNSIAIAMYGATIGRLGIFGVEACTNQACCVLANPRNGSYQFLYYCFQAAKASIIRRAIGGGQPNINQDTIRALRFPNPSREEQRQIAAYLNRETAKIDKLIAKQQKLIKLLQEKRQAVISQAVTKGLDPNVKMKHSGIDWLGEVPEHWNVKKLKFLTRFYSGGTPQRDKSEYWNGDIPWISPKDMKHDLIDSAEESITSLGLSESATRLIPIESLLMVVRSGILQHTIPVGVTSKEVSINQDIKGITFFSELKAFFLFFIFKGLNNQMLFLLRKEGATVESLEQSYLENLYIPVPPQTEQIQIIKHLDEISALFANLQEKAKRSIVLLREHRQALITAAVTGKIDVRGLVTDEEVAALDAESEVETTEEDLTSEVLEDTYITEEE